MSKYFNNIIYGVNSFITGLKLTWEHFSKKKDLVATLQYPHEKWPLPERNIGFDHSEYNLIRSRLHVDIDDCIACMQCERACPVDCIKIDSIKPPKSNEFDCGMTSNDTQKKMIVSRFTIDMSECMYCNLCVYPCPEECIYMVGGPNAQKHEIDYEFSQYKRDGMVFEFADATDEIIKDAGGDEWLEQRDGQRAKILEGNELQGNVEEKPAPLAEVRKKTEDDKGSPVKVDPRKISSELAITSFNDIPDKMTRGIAKKAFTAANRDGKDKTGILADVAQALSDANKMSDDIQLILNGLAGPVQTEDIALDKKVLEMSTASTETKSDVFLKPVEMDIKDLNIIEDKMVRGTAKKAFLGAKRKNENTVAVITKMLKDGGFMTLEIENMLKKYSKPVAGKNENEKLILDMDSPEDIDQNLPLFEIADLNGIEDKMARGIAKKAYTAGKRAKKSRIDVIEDIRTALSASDKLDEFCENLMNTLEKTS